MQFFKHFWIGLKSYWDALSFIKTHKLYWYWFIPATLMLGIYWVGARIHMHRPLREIETVNDIVWHLIYVLIEVSIAILLMKFAKYLVVILLSPMIAHLSQKSEKILTGNRYPFNFKLLVHDVKRGIRIATRNLMWEYFFFLIIFIVSVFGWENPKDSPIFYLTFIIGFYYYGFSFLDYINERRRLTMDESIIFVRKHRGLAIAIGSIYTLLILVPIDIGVLFSFARSGHNFWSSLGNFSWHLLLWICAAFAPIWCIVAATLAMNKIVGLKR